MNEQQKYRIIMQGMRSGNVAETCKEFGISRTLYYRWYHAYIRQGMAGLSEKPRLPVMPNQVDRRTERMILQYVVRSPEDGPRRIYYELQEEGIRTGESGIYNVLRRHGLSRRGEREKFAEEIKSRKGSRGRRSDSGQSADNRQLHSMRPKGERHPQLDYRMEDAEHAYPGYICLQTIQYLGKFPEVGRVYQYIILDSYSRLALVKLYNQRSSINLIDFMRFRIMPLLRTFHLKIDHLVTNKSQEFSTAWERGTHKYTDYLHKHDIHFIAYSADHSEVFQPLHEFTGVLMNRFYQPLWHEGSPSSFNSLEQCLDQYMKHYNYVRPLEEGGNRGKIPSDIVLDSRGIQEPLPLWLYTRR
ncbi:helix-turn-helix domain-containing protein [Paenibacillus sp. GM2]|uniref:helix-turn-helix domain-containing protein n=1 Tax=Paenibacillus sp. GM2 TaxID=1622070 RepID=UPI000839BE92|nr:helix-turn-helix domain-containing protein [Paenibacillus sp. GM2]